MNGTETTTYVGGLLEKKFTTSTNLTYYRHYVVTPSGRTIVVSRNSDHSSSTSFALSDHLDSTDAVVDSSGNFKVQESFGAFGQRRAGNTWSGTPSSADAAAIAATTREGFTGHEMLDNVNLIHMNGRVYDPVTGRFLSADPYVPPPGFSQSYNRYSYVTNNSLSYVDPSGFEETVIVTGGGSGGSDDYSGGDYSGGGGYSPSIPYNLINAIMSYIRTHIGKNSVNGTTTSPPAAEPTEQVVVQGTRPTNPEDILSDLWLPPEFFFVPQGPLQIVTVTGHKTKGNQNQNQKPPCSSITGASLSFTSQIDIYGSFGLHGKLFGLRIGFDFGLNLISYNTQLHGNTYLGHGIDATVQIGPVRGGVSWEQQSDNGGLSFQSQPTNFLLGDLKGSSEGADFEVTPPQAFAGFKAGIDNVGALLPTGDTPQCHP